MQLTMTLRGDLGPWLNFVGSDQLPYVGARALTWTAQDCQREVQRLLPQRFTIRNTWTEKGIRIQPATKSNLTAVIYSRDDYMERQETGGTKTPKGRSLTLPTTNVKRSKRDIVQRGQRAKALLSKPGYFSGTIGSTPGVWKRPGAEGGRPKLMFAYVFSAQVPARFGYEEAVTRTFNERFERLFDLSWGQAMG